MPTVKLHTKITVSVYSALLYFFALSCESALVVPESCDAPESPKLVQLLEEEDMASDPNYIQLLQSVGKLKKAIPTQMTEGTSNESGDMQKPGEPEDDILLLDRKALNQTLGYHQSLANWTLVTEGPDHFVEHVQDANIRFKTEAGNVVHGVFHPLTITQMNWNILRAGMVHRPSDVWVATYPKSGTTFMLQIIALLQNGGDLAGMATEHWPEQDVTFDIPGFGKLQTGNSATTLSLPGLDSLVAPRVFKTHATRELFLATKPVEPPSFSSTGLPDPLVPGVKVVYVARNPKDACVSMYNFPIPRATGMPFDAWVKFWTSGLNDFGRWSDHVAGWHAEASGNQQQVLWVEYEDLLSQPHREVLRVATFLGLGSSDEVINATVLHSSITYMKTQCKGRMECQLLHKGEAGSWKQYFSPELSKEFDEELHELMRGHDSWQASEKGDSWQASEKGGTRQQTLSMLLAAGVAHDVMSF